MMIVFALGNLIQMENEKKLKKVSLSTLYASLYLKKPRTLGRNINSISIFKCCRFFCFPYPIATFLLTVSYIVALAETCN